MFVGWHWHLKGVVGPTTGGLDLLQEGIHGRVAHPHERGEDLSSTLVAGGCGDGGGGPRHGVAEESGDDSVMIIIWRQYTVYGNPALLDYRIQ